LLGTTTMMEHRFM